MATIINASTSAGLVQTADTSGVLALQSNGTTIVAVTSTGAAVTGTLSSTGNTTLGDASTDTLNVGNGDLIKDASGNVGIGVTPSAWGAPYKSSIELANSYSLYSGQSGTVTGGILLNAYYNGSNFIFKTGAGAGYATLYQNTQGQHQWFTASGGTAGNPITFTQAMTLDARGNLGLGVTPSAWTSTSQKAMEFAYVGNAIVSTGAGSIQMVANGYYDSGWKYATTASTASARFYVDSGGSYWESAVAGTAGNALTWLSRMTLDAGGYLNVGTNGVSAHAFNWSAAVRMQFNNTIASAGNQYGQLISYTNAAPNNAGNEFFYCQDSAGIRASIRSNGGLANYQANNINLSDAREKTNIELAGSYLNKICAIPVKTFNYIDQNLEEDAGLTLGVVAQDVQAICPELIMESNWGKADEEEKLRLSIYQTDLQYALMKSVQELKAIVDTQAEQIKALQGAK